MLNEHHGTPFCLGAVMDVEASILAKAHQEAEDGPARQSGRRPSPIRCAWPKSWR